MADQQECGSKSRRTWEYISNSHMWLRFGNLWVDRDHSPQVEISSELLSGPSRLWGRGKGTGKLQVKRSRGTSLVVNAGDTGSNPGPGRYHMPSSN